VHTFDCNFAGKSQLKGRHFYHQTWWVGPPGHRSPGSAASALPCLLLAAQLCALRGRRWAGIAAGLMTPPCALNPAPLALPCSLGSRTEQVRTHNATLQFMTLEEAIAQQGHQQVDLLKVCTRQYRQNKLC